MGHCCVLAVLYLLSYGKRNLARGRNAVVGMKHVLSKLEDSTLYIVPWFEPIDIIKNAV